MDRGLGVIEHPYCGTGYVLAEWATRLGRRPTLVLRRVGSSAGTQYPVLFSRATGRCLDSRSNGNPPARVVLQRWDCIGWAIDWNSATPAVAVRQRGLPLIW